MSGENRAPKKRVRHLVLDLSWIRTEITFDARLLLKDKPLSDLESRSAKPLFVGSIPTRASKQLALITGVQVDLQSTPQDSLFLPVLPTGSGQRAGKDRDR